jgi:choline monooxygenase
MRFDDLSIDPDIRRARTLPAAVYRDAAAFEHQRATLFARTWHLRPVDATADSAANVCPWNLLPGCLDEPLVRTHAEDGRVHLLSNVCTHRGKVLVDRPCEANGIRCGYHGRRFALDGTMTSAPGFEDAIDFPDTSDHLRRVPQGTWGPFEFASLDPAQSFEAFSAPLRERFGHLPLDEMKFEPRRSRSFHVDANWALYCDNYLEGFHIPYVHPDLNRALDFEQYRVETLEHASMQVGVAAADELAFDLPAGHPDHGQRIAAYYLFLFPATMFNVYPWGISVNVVLPLGPHACRVEFLRFVWDPEKHGRGAGSGLEQVEYEDEAVVESTARGLRSRLYERGRYSPKHEVAVHHFHRLVAEFMRGD